MANSSASLRGWEAVVSWRNGSFIHQPHQRETGDGSDSAHQGRKWSKHLSIKNQTHAALPQVIVTRILNSGSWCAQFVCDLHPVMVSWHVLLQVRHEDHLG